MVAGTINLNERKARCLFLRFQLTSIRHTLTPSYGGKSIRQRWLQECAKSQGRFS